jgi:hypothetical protein
MARKFIVTDKQFIYANVELHMDMVKNLSDKERPVLGGGRWDIDEGKRVMYLWGESIDYGYAKPDDIKRAIEGEDTWVSPRLEGFTVLHSPIIMASRPEEEDFEVLMILPE